MIIDILTGQVQSGKTTLLQKITSELKRKDISVGGFLNPSVHEKGQVTGYDLFDLREETKHPFLRKKGQADWEQIGPYFFVPDTLKQARSIIRHVKRTDICFVDEIGPYELEGKGLWPELEAILEHPIPGLFLTVRTKLLDILLDRLGKKVDKIFYITNADVHLQIIAHLEQKLYR